MAKKKTSKKKSTKKKSAKKRSARKKMSKKAKAIVAGLRARKPTSTPAKKKRRKRKVKSVSHALSKGGGGAKATRRKGGKRMSTKVKVGRVGAKVSCPAGSTLITSSVTRKKKDPSTGKVKKMTYIAGQCVML